MQIKNGLENNNKTQLCNFGNLLNIQRFIASAPPLFIFKIYGSVLIKSLTIIPNFVKNWISYTSIMHLDQRRILRH